MTKFITYMRLTNKQKEIIKLMQDGWELGFDNHANNVWIQKNGVGYGGDSVNMRMSTFKSLQSMELIFGEYHFPVSKYHLTDLGKNIVI